MKSRATRKIGRWIRDMGLGAAIFMSLPVIGFATSATDAPWKIDAANAGEVIATRAIEVTAPPGPGTENAIVAAAQMRAAGDPLIDRRMREMAVLGLAFSLMVAGNLAFLRHLRRESASPRRGEWGRRQDQ